MGNILSSDNETWVSAQQEGGAKKIANFDYFIKYSGRDVVGFEGIMFEVYGSGITDICIVKVFRNANTGTSLEFCQDYLSRCSRIKKFEEEYKKQFRGQFTFRKCYIAEMDTVAIFNLSFKRKKNGNKRRRIHRNEWVVFEAKIRGKFKTFVSEKGNISAECPESIETFCHFIYHQSEGTVLATGLKGVKKKNGSVQLTTPSLVCVREQNDIADRFFDQHICNNVCKHWLKPKFLLPSTGISDSTRIGLHLSDELESKPPPYCQDDYERFHSGNVSVESQPFDPPPPYEAHCSVCHDKDTMARHIVQRIFPSAPSISSFAIQH